jgi:hypothetical protein
MDFQNVNCQYNFNLAEVQVNEMINVVFVIDISAYIIDCVDDPHFAFNEKLQIITGFQLITALKLATYKPAGVATASRYYAVAGLRNALDYRRQLENSGINVKNIFNH